MGWLWLVLGAAALAATSLAAAAALRLPSLPSFALAAYVLGCGTLVLLGEALSLVRAANGYGYAAGQALLLGAAAAAWRARGRPRPPAPPPLPPVRELARAHPLVAALGALVAAAFGYELFLVLATPPSNWDSMTYHLPRVVYWLHNGGIAYDPQPTTQRVNAYQPGSELEILWTFALLQRDTVAALPQLLAEAASVVAVFSIARSLGFRRAAASFAALLAATPTEIALQSVTTQNDLLAASFTAAAAALVLRRTRAEVALAGLAVGLALGTKLTSAFALPILLALALAVLPRRRLVEGLAYAAGGFLLLGLYGYAFNLVHDGRLLGDPSASEAFRPSEVTLGGTVSTVARVGFRLVDLSGFHPPTAFAAAISDAGRAVFDGLGIEANPPETTAGGKFDFAVGQEPNEDLSYFGPLGALLLAPLALASAVAALARRRRRDLPRLALALSLPVIVLEVALTYRYNVWLGRFLITPVVLTLPLAAVLYRARLAAWAAALLGALTLALAHAFNHAKPTGLEGSRAVWSMSRAEAMSTTRPEMKQVIEGVAEKVRVDARLGTVLGPDDWVYPLYGPKLERTLVPLEERRLLQQAEERNVDWIVLDDEARRPPPRKYWYTLDFVDSGWRLYLHPEEL